MICKRHTSHGAGGLHMRDYLNLYVNGKHLKVTREEAFLPLSTYLRQIQGATGTKVVCEEGDCGACSVIVGRMENGDISYKPINSCIQFMYQLDCAHVVTIEGLRVDEALNPIQEAMVQCHGAQCGYCTPGFVVTMCAMFENCAPKNEQDVKDGLTGNLCRCTGYEPIIKASLSVDPEKVLKLHELYPTAEMRKSFEQHCAVGVEISTPDHTLCIPHTLDEAVNFKAANPGTVVVAGGTDVCVYWNKRGIEPRALMSVSQLSALRELKVENGTLIVGARATLAELEDYAKDIFPELNRMLWLFGSPQIRNSGTLVGNIANASPIADTLPFLFVAEAVIELFGKNGIRQVNINKFYKGYKNLDMNSDEIITRVLIPIPAKEETIRLYKVSKRKNLDISAFTAAFRLKLSEGTIKSIRIAYGGVAPVVCRLPKTEAHLTGKLFTEASMTEAGAIALSEITPISDVRGSRDFRNTLAENILLKLWFDIQETQELVCQQ